MKAVQRSPDNGDNFTGDANDNSFTGDLLAAGVALVWALMKD